ncbi:MAG TPA: hypothetical protein H9711_03330 [Candidatus Mediterraneibacter intestinavium]|nr:hypothetical protein [Candidatus Mediterraneibacter intestinavium]
MLDKKRIRLMARTAIYEKEHAEEDVKISTYYKKDYASLNTWITLIWVTVGYVLLVGIFLLCTADSIMEGLTIVKLILLAAIALGFYLVLLILYGIGAGNFYRKKHGRAKHRVKRYYRELSRLEKMYKKEKNRP